MAPQSPKLTPSQINTLNEIAYPDEYDNPFPRVGTLGVLLRLGLVEVVKDDDDIFARMTGGLIVRATPAGMAILNREEAAS